MSIDEPSFKSALNELLNVVAQLPRSKSIGYKGEASPLRTGLYFEFQTPYGIHVADPAILLAGELALRQWITVRGGKAGGKETVEPGGGLNLGGLGVAGLLRMLTSLGRVQGLQISTQQPGGGFPTSQEQLLHLLQTYLAAKAEGIGRPR